MDTNKLLKNRKIAYIIKFIYPCIVFCPEFHKITARDFFKQSDIGKRFQKKRRGRVPSLFFLSISLFD